MLVALQAAPARIPVIIVSAYARLIDRCQVAGAHQKPYGALALLRDIERNLPAGRAPLYTADQVLARLFPHPRPPHTVETPPLLEEVEQFLRHVRGAG